MKAKVLTLSGSTLQEVEWNVEEILTPNGIKPLRRTKDLFLEQQHQEELLRQQKRLNKEIMMYFER